jgi:DMSO/TMAO reductase YedYZ heme-binding membrane subunit
MDQVFPADKIFNFHQFVGKLAFVLVISQPVFLFATFFFERNLNYIIPFWKGSNFFYFSFGILALLLFILTVGAALMRFRIGLKWIYIHRLNYLIFWLIFFHSLALGVDLQSQQAKLLYISYGIIVGFLTIRRFITR